MSNAPSFSIVFEERQITYAGLALNQAQQKND